VPIPRRPPRRAGPPIRRFPWPVARRQRRRPPRGPAGLSSDLRSQAAKGTGPLHSPHADGHVSRPFSRRRKRAQDHPPRGEQAAWVVMARQPSRPRQTAGTFLFGAYRRRWATRRARRVIVVKTPRRIGEATFDRLEKRAETLARPKKAANESRAVPLRGSAGSAESTSITASSPTSTAWSISRNSGLTVSLVLPAAQRGRDDRHHRVPGSTRPDGAPPAGRRALLMDSDSTDGDARNRRVGGSSGRVHSQVLTRYGSYCGKRSALEELYETSGDIIVWPHGRANCIRGWSTAPWPAHRRRAAAVRQGLLPRPIVEGGVLKVGGGGRVTRAWSRARSSTSSTPSCPA